MSDEHPERGFKVSDRRRFSSEGEPREASDAPAPSQAGAPAGERSTAAAESYAKAHGSAPAAAEVSFTTFVLGLSTQALIALGEVEDPEAGPYPPDLVAAKQLIDIVGMLQAKTRGNLEPSESALLDHLLYDLRMKYVERARAK